jgi:chemotaxis protein MotB
LKDWLDVVKDQDRYRIENRLPLLFASGSARIANEYDIFLDNLALVLKDCPMNVFVDGYADIDPINTTKYPSNFELGAVRAANVVHALIKKGMDPSMFKIGSTGRYRFAGHEASEWKALERHVNITVVLEP